MIILVVYRRHLYEIVAFQSHISIIACNGIEHTGIDITGNLANSVHRLFDFR